MFSDIIKVGMNLELSQKTDSKEENTVEGISYSSKIQDVFPNGDLEIDMPLYQNKLVLLHNGVRYDIAFYAQNNTTYTAVGEVVDRYKSGNRYLLRMELKTQPVKFQRREFFRFECMLDFSYHDMEIRDEEEDLSKVLEQVKKKDSEQEWKNGVALDISGGGIRFISKEELTVGTYKRFYFELPVAGKLREIDAIGVVLSCKSSEGSKVKFENRIRFEYLSNACREAIIRFIFEEERKARKKSR